MDDSILNSTKKVVGLAADYTPFDPDMIIFINSAFSFVTQFGIGPAEGFQIEDDTAVWSDITYVDPVTQAELPMPMKQLNMLKTYIYLRVRRMFDPASTRFVIAAINQQIDEHEWRLKQFMDELQPIVKPQPTLEYIDIFTGSEVTLE